MTAPPDTELDVDALMRQIRAELASRIDPKNSANPAVEPQPGLEAVLRLPRIAESNGHASRKSSYELNELLAYHDESFIRNAYLAILGREPDAEGASRFLAALRRGELAKVEVLGRIRYSPEGRSARVPIRGLTVTFAIRTLRRVPLLGRLIGILQYVWRLPTVVRNIERLEAVVFQHRGEVQRVVNAADAQIEISVNRLQQRLADIVDAEERATRERVAFGAQLDKRLDRIEREGAGIDALRELGGQHSIALETMRERLDEERQLRASIDSRLDGVERGKAELADISALRERTERHAIALETIQRHLDEERELRTLIDARLDRVEHGKAELSDLTTAVAASTDLMTDLRNVESELTRLREQLNAWRSDLAGEERRLAILLDQSQPREPVAVASEQSKAIATVQRSGFDRFYVDLEERFRGAREDIASRVAVYVPYIRSAGAGTAAAPVLDIGSGRGELLEVLRDNGLVANGVDSNRVMVAGCRERGLAVAEADALEYLSSLETGSLGAIAAIHVIEHLPFARMVALFDEARRALRPGGIVLFETPNPENLVVGACYFYSDPTHLRPLPPDLLRFVLAHRGFADVEVLRLHPRHDAPAREGEMGQLDMEATRRFFGEQDYAVIGYKPRAA